VGKQDTISLGNYAPVPRDTSSSLPRPTQRQATLSKRQLRLLAIRSLSIDTITHSAYIRLTSFSKGNLKSFFRRSFKKLKEENIQHLMLDLRENGGGKISNSIALTKYLKKTPFKIADSVVAISRKFKHGKYIQSSWLYWLAMNLVGSKAADGTIHYKRFERHYYQPKTRFAFKGKTYLVQGGYTFSAATMVVGALKGQENIQVVGEESGGGEYGNSAMHIPYITLPNTKLRVRLPLYRMVINQTLQKGRGIEPDIKIPPSSYAIRVGFDPKMAAIQAFIKNKNN
jgi:C-terminal processing protease CtpA/Prc